MSVAELPSTSVALGLNPDELYVRTLLAWPFEAYALTRERMLQNHAPSVIDLPPNSKVRLVGELASFGSELALGGMNAATTHRVHLEATKALDGLRQYLGGLYVDTLVEVCPIAHRRSHSAGHLLQLYGVERPYQRGMESGYLRAQVLSVAKMNSRGAFPMTLGLDPEGRERLAWEATLSEETFKNKTFAGQSPGMPIEGDVIGVRIDAVKGDLIQTSRWPDLIYRPSPIAYSI